MKRRARPAPQSQREKIKAFLDERLDEGSDGAYEALQLLRGQVQRGLKQGGVAAAGAAEVAKEGALALVGRGFVASGAEMALQLVEAFGRSDFMGAENTEQGVLSLLEVDAAFGACGRALTRDEAVDRFRGAKAAVAWSRRRSEVGAHLLGDPRLHAAAGHAAWTVARLEHGTAAEGGGGGSLHLAWAEQGIKHLVLGEAPSALADVLSGPDAVLVAPRGSGLAARRRERAAAVLRAVLQFLAVENLRDANLLWRHLVPQLPEGDAKQQPALAAVPTLLKTCEFNAPQCFQELRQRMGDGALACGAVHAPGAPSKAAAGGAHPAQLLPVIGQKLFGVAPPPNMLNTILSMFGGGDEE